MLGTKKAGSQAVTEVGMTGGIRDGDGVSSDRSRSQVPATLRGDMRRDCLDVPSTLIALPKVSYGTE